MAEDLILQAPKGFNAATDAELERLIARYRNAGGIGFELLNALGGQAEDLLDKLPAPVRDGLEGATEKALFKAMKLAHGSRSVVGDRVGWLNAAVAGALGAVGGVGGAPTALAEIPITTTVLLRAIQGEAAKLGFDPASENIQFDCVQVFGAAGPLAKDDGADMGFVSARLALTSGTMQTVIAKVTPKLAVVLGQKLAAQAVPVLGAVAGATVNFSYLGYYQEIAHVHFGLRKLSIDSGVSHEHLVAELKRRMEPARLTGGSV
ncbi:EcsC family protein [uncultured Shimia sp.]|uniref:EcsC family protein n=1 Tax=uncultured Shimia sp. TaxID=573152 RepID=UPI002616C1B4|nr:EcsC family protein [uncultured Shimia sp.]